MGAVRAALCALTLLAGVPARADEVERWRPLVAEASARFGMPVPWIERVMAAESRGRTTLGGRPITSPAGAMGLMQLMPGTWADMRTRLGLGTDPHNPRDNILAGTFYLRLMYDQFGYPGLFGAYNAGPRRYRDHLAGAALPRETVAYMAAMTRGRGGAAALTVTAMPAAPPVNPIFFVGSVSSRAAMGGPGTIFVALNEPSKR